MSTLPPPRKRFGQNFLTDARALQRIVDALNPQPGETIVEVGPGRGALTDVLVPRASRLIAVEIDRDLVTHLRTKYAGQSHVSIVQGDVLNQSLGDLAGGPYALVGNLPYYITTPILFHALASPRPSRIVILVQREVAERLRSQPGDDDYGALTVNVATYADVELVAVVPASAFDPRPKVDSAVVRVTPRAVPLCEAHEERPLRELVVGLFGQRRRQMARAVRTVRDLTAEQARAVLQSCEIDPMARPEVLAADAFVRLLRALRDPNDRDSSVQS